MKSATRHLVALLCILLPVAGSAAGQPAVHHSLDVTLDPAGGSLIVADEVRFSNGPREQLLFTLNAGLTISAAEGVLETLAGKNKPGHQLYRLTLDEPRDRISLEFRGKPLTPAYKGMDGMPAAILSPGGVYLDAGSAWYPDFGGIIEGFELSISLPDGWQSVSQGKRSLRDGRQQWTSTTPEQEIYLVAGPFTRYTREHDDIDLSVYLLTPDETLAATYLRTMGGYIDRYSRLIGDYPFPKFAVVENRWQTGYGMPSFTLLGSRVMRLPFIPYTSLPHEILHNWWGNGVWVDYGRGNWSEGLTAYLSDYLMKELQGEDADYRRKALERYADFAAEKRDFPLIDFVSRHSDASQAVGYSKSLMLFHMLRMELGDEVFTQGLRELWDNHKFSMTGFEQVLESFSRVSGQSLDDDREWLTRTGAPSITLDDISLDETGSGYRLSFSLQQGQQDVPYPLRLVAAIALEEREEAMLREIRLDRNRERITLELPSRPLRLDIDPAFDALRLLDDSERPPTFGQLYGSTRWYLVLPSHAPQKEREAWMLFAKTWQQRYPDLEIVDDSDSAKIPADADLLLAGWSNRLLDAYRQRLESVSQRHGETLLLAGKEFDRESHSVALMAARGERHLGFIAAADAAAIPSLARKLPHYGSYGMLVFDASGQNRLKQSAPVTDSRLTHHFTQEETPLQLPARKPLVD
ncbi:MAG: M1 family aminopeptidase [Gammaproteobacteria bacterium]